MLTIFISYITQYRVTRAEGEDKARLVGAQEVKEEGLLQDLGRHKVSDRRRDQEGLQEVSLEVASGQELIVGGV